MFGTSRREEKNKSIIHPEKNEMSQESKKSMCCFWKETHPFSNWYRCTLKIDDRQFSCVEQYMMWRKACLFEDKAMAAAILALEHPYEMREAGRKVKGFKEDVWAQEREAIVEKALLVKFQDPKLRDMLLNTKGRVIAETAEWDPVWGTGANEADTQRGHWKGLNLLGKLLMKVRDKP